MAGDGGSEAGVPHSRGMAVGDGLDEDGIGSHLTPINIFEVLLLQDGEQEASHGIIAVRRHDGELVLDLKLISGGYVGVKSGWVKKRLSGLDVWYGYRNGK